MNYETVERCGRLHVVKNGVESACFAQPALRGRWATTMPQVEFTTSTRAIALDLIAGGMDDWHTVTEAAIRLVELGKADKPPALKTMYRWIHGGQLPGAIKVDTVGRGGSWRIPEEALREFTKRGGEKK